MPRVGIEGEQGEVAEIASKGSQGTQGGKAHGQQGFGLRGREAQVDAGKSGRSVPGQREKGGRSSREGFTG